MRADLPETIRKIAGFIDLDASDDEVQRVVHATDFDNVKAKAAAADAKADPKAPRFFENGGAGFFFKGTNGRWRDVLDEDDVALYEQAKSRVLTEDCATWLERGGEMF